MSADDTRSGLQLRSLIKDDGTLELSLVRVPTPDPAPDEVVVRIEAAPINPSDLALLLGAADMSTAQATGTLEHPTLTATIPEKLRTGMAGRLGQSMPVGNEGAGVVVRAGSSPEAQALLGQTVAALGGAMYSEYRCLKVTQCLPLPEDVTPAEGASCFVNPLTALGMVETMRREGHTALVHTAAASNLGRMLVKICRDDAVALVNVVRSAAHRDTLLALGAVHVCSTDSPTFKQDLTRTLVATGATLAFDAVGGGRLAGDLLSCMENALNEKAATYSRYGSATHKQVYIYGKLDPGPTELAGSFGMAWGVGGWLVSPFLQKIGAAGAQKLRERIVRELKTTFASSYSGALSLAQALTPAAIAAYGKRATGEKYLVTPHASRARGAAR